MFMEGDPFPLSYHQLHGYVLLMPVEEEALKCNVRLNENIAAMNISMFISSPIESQKLDLSKPGFDMDVFQTSSSIPIPNRVRCISQYKHCEATE